MKLSILCVTRAQRRVLPLVERMLDLSFRNKEWECVLAADGKDAYSELEYLSRFARVVQVESAGYVESVLDEAIGACQGEYILRLDDDESVSPTMVRWLDRSAFIAEPHWCFSRAWLWLDPGHFLRMEPFWPDYQTRLSLKAQSGGRSLVHQGSPYGLGHVAPTTIEHHKLLLWSHRERLAHVAHYDQLSSGAGQASRGFYLPEELPSLVINSWAVTR
jgi:hypothetical protein